MQLNKASKAMAAALVIAAPFLSIASDAALAKSPGNRPACAVGSAAYPTIQSAVNDTACTTIGVPAGTFYENVNILRSVTIRGEGPGRTIVNGSQNLAPAFKADFSFRTDRPLCGSPVIAVTLEDMTITGGTGPASGNNRNGGGISSFWIHLTVSNVLVTGNSTFGHGGGMSNVHGTITVKDSVITHNTAHGYGSIGSPPAGGGGGIRLAGCPNVVKVYDTVISHNVSDTLGGGITINAPATMGNPPVPGYPATLTVMDSSITDNTAAGSNSGGGIFYDYTILTVKHTQIRSNAPNNLQEGQNPVP
jgi:hypothetical protein